MQVAKRRRGEAGIVLLLVVLCCCRLPSARAGDVSPDPASEEVLSAAVDASEELPSAAVQSSGNAAAQAAEEVPRVLARLGPKHCNPATHSPGAALPSATISSINTLAAVTGLSYAGGLPVRCWHVFDPAPTLAATQTAVDVLTQRTPLSLNAATSSAAASAAGVDGEPVFTAAALELTRKPYITTSYPTVQQQQQQQQQAAAAGGGSGSSRRQLQQAAADVNSSTAWQYLPPECDATSNTCSNWGLRESKIIELWQDLGPQLFPLRNITYKAALIDTGIEPRQFNVLPQLSANESITFSRDGNNPPDGQFSSVGHGTHVFGIMAAGHGRFRQQNDPSGVAGVVGPAPRSVASCNCFGKHQDGRDGDVVSCIAHAVATSTHWVVNLSLGDENSRDNSTHQLYLDAFSGLCAAGGIAVIAAGNGVCVGSGCVLGQQGPRNYVGVDISDAGLQPDGVTKKPNIASYPAVMAEYFPDCVIAVANINIAGQLVSDSHFGAAVRIAAPGTDIVSSWPVYRSGNTWQAFVISGTSMASPHVAGAALLLRNAFPNATAAQVVRCLISGSSQPPAFLNPGRVLGGGMLDVRAAYVCLAVEMQQEPPFNCRVQDVPSCVDASSGVRDSGCAEPYFCKIISNNTGGNNTAGNGTNGNSASGSTSAWSSNSTATCDAPSVCGPNTVCNTTEQGNVCSCSPGYKPPGNGSIEGTGCTSSGNTATNGTGCAAPDSCGPNTSCNTTDSGAVCSCLPGYSPPVNGTIQQQGCFNSTSNSTHPEPPGSQLITCRYKYRTAKSDCTAEGGARSSCGGNSSCHMPSQQSCPRPPPQLNNTQFADPPTQNCSAQAAVGSSCNATCAPGWRGAGYSVTCLLDGNWSIPASSGCRELPVVPTVCGACTVGTVCGEADGCTCLMKGRGSGRCLCAASLGFKHLARVQAGVLTSRCVWDVRFPWMDVTSRDGRRVAPYLVAKVNSTMGLPFTVGINSSSSSSGNATGGQQVCPSRLVISSVQWLRALPACPTGPFSQPIRMAVSKQPLGEACNPRLANSFLYFDTSEAPAAKCGSCFAVRFRTTDGMAYATRVLFK